MAYTEQDIRDFFAHIEAVRAAWSAEFDYTPGEYVSFPVLGGDRLHFLDYDRYEGSSECGPIPLLAFTDFDAAAMEMRAERALRAAKDEAKRAYEVRATLVNLAREVGATINWPD